MQGLHVYQYLTREVLLLTIYGTVGASRSFEADVQVRTHTVLELAPDELSKIM